jgi:two-component system, NarL family, invasion response regulator UvrY
MKILLVDDHALVRAGIRLILQGLAAGVSFDDADEGGEALLKVRGNDYDLVILDLSLPDISGFQVLAGIKREKPTTPVIIVSMHREEQYAVKAYAEGADGFVSKGSTPAELVHAVEKVMAGGKFISEQLMDAVVEGLRYANPMDGQQQKPRVLSKREQEVAHLLVAGSSNKEIAWQMSLSTKTVSTYKTRILNKLGLKCLAELVRYSLVHGSTYSE